LLRFTLPPTSLPRRRDTPSTTLPPLFTAFFAAARYAATPFSSLLMRRALICAGAMRGALLRRCGAQMPRAALRQRDAMMLKTRCRDSAADVLLAQKMLRAMRVCHCHSPSTIFFSAFHCHFADAIRHFHYAGRLIDAFAFQTLMLLFSFFMPLSLRQFSILIIIAAAADTLMPMPLFSRFSFFDIFAAAAFSFEIFIAAFFLS
jgi:hypothetical protein